MTSGQFKSLLDQNVLIFDRLECVNGELCAIMTAPDGAEWHVNRECLIPDARTERLSPKSRLSPALKSAADALTNATIQVFLRKLVHEQKDMYLRALILQDNLFQLRFHEDPYAPLTNTADNMAYSLTRDDILMIMHRPIGIMSYVSKAQEDHTLEAVNDHNRQVLYSLIDPEYLDSCRDMQCFIAY